MRIGPWLLVTALFTGCPIEESPADDDDITGDDDISGDDDDATGSCDNDAEGPVVEITPSDHTFDPLEVGCTAQQEFVIRSGGTEPLEIESIVFWPTSPELVSSHEIEDGALLEPCETATVTVLYEPSDNLPDSADLHVNTNDPNHDDAVITISATATWLDEVEEEFEQEGNNWVDILWVVDDAGSMVDEQASLALNFSSFVGMLDTLDLDYHIAVITPRDPHFVGGIPILTPYAPDVANQFAANADVGTGGAGPAEILVHAVEALTPPLAAPGGAHDGFLRDDAGLRIIAASDGDDESDGQVSDHVGEVQGIKDDPTHVAISAISGQVQGCTGSENTAGAAPRLEQAVAETSGLSASICDEDWLDEIAGLDWLAVTPSDTFVLGQVPVESTIEVQLNQLECSVGWNYDADLNAIVWEPEYVPDFGDWITVAYRPMPAC